MSEAATMDDAEVTRQAVGMSLAAMSRLDTLSREAHCEADALLAYVQLCPFVASKSPAMATAIKALKGVKSQPDEKNSSSASATMEATIHNPASTPNAEDATRAALRITVAAFSKLLVQSESLDDFQVLKKYLQLCPFVDPASSYAATAAMQGLEYAQRGGPSNPSSSAKSSKNEKQKQGVESPVSGNSSSCCNDNDNSSPSQSDHNKKRTRILRPMLVLLRSLVLDFPMALLFASYLFLTWVRRVDELYIKPSMDAVLWSDERAEQEITYYHRECDARDVTTRNANDLLVPINATIQEAYNHQLFHGFSLFQNVLTDNAMRDLRTYVDSRNRKLSKEESIFVIENQNRFSFGLGTEEPCVVEAIEQLATHPQLSSTLEKVLGPDPALIEMTAITSSYGAVAQYWHDDVIAPASVMKYGRTFGPSYSVFIQLQNTTKEMGATDTCPGTHKCAGGDIDTFCEDVGFQAVDNTTGYWKAGDALLMNMNSFHRGAAHVGKDAPDRVMLILTFVPKPVERAESRQLSQGITFSLRWDMWGHTLSDLANSKTRMSQPRATLRALGLYKLRDASWGIDYVSSATMRMSNEDNGFRPDELDDFLERGGFHWIPQFLQGQVAEEGNWHDFLVDTLERCLEFVFYSNVLIVALYAISLAIIALAAPVDFGFRGFRNSVLRSSIIYGLLFLVWQAANNHVDNTHWAKDIKAGRKYTDAFRNEHTYTPKLSHLPSTLPHRKDVLIETRYGSRQLHMYNDFTNDHPGSRVFHRLVREHKTAYASANSEFFRDALAAYIVSAIEETSGRFLLQNGNTWLWLSKDDTIDYAKAELVAALNPQLKHLRQEFRFLESDYKYGYLRNTAMARTSLDSLKHFKNRLLRTSSIGNVIFTSPFDFESSPTYKSRNKQATFLKSKKPKLFLSSTEKPLNELMTKRKRVLNVAAKPTEPRYGAWLKSGDIVEGTEFLDGGKEAHWYKGILHQVTASGDYYVIYDDGSYAILSNNLIRSFKPYIAGEDLEILLAEEDNGEPTVDSCTIVTDYGDGTLDVFIDEDEELLERVSSGDLRRPRKDFVFDEEKEVLNKYV